MSAEQLANIGKGIVQINLRMSRVLELLERPAADSGDPAEREALLDLLDALERALAAPRPRTGLWSWLWGRDQGTSDALRRGIELALARAREQLRRLGIEVIDTTGSFDASLHEALERLPTPAGVAAGTIVRTHRTGFVVVGGAGRRVLRFAQVSVYGGPASESEHGETC